MTRIPRNPLAFGWWATGGKRKLMFTCWTAVVLGVLLTRYEFYIISQLVDSATTFDQGKERIDTLWKWAALLGGIYCIGEVLWRVSGFSAQRWMTAANAHVYDKLFQYLTGHSARYFHSRFAGAITNKISNAASGVMGLLQLTTWNFLTLSTGIVADCLLLYSAHYIFTIILVIWFSIFLTVDFFLVLRLRKLSFAHAEAASQLKGKLVDSATNIDSVHQQAEEPFEHRYVGRYIEGERNAHRRSWFMFEWILVSNGVLLGLFIVLMLGTSIYMFQYRYISLGSVVMMITIVFNLEKTLFFLGEQMSRAMQLYGQIDEGLKELLEPHEVRSTHDAPELEVEKGAIEIRELSFGYSQRKVFRNLSLSVGGGSKIGLVGPSGAGKSTLINLLLRQYDLQSGSIRIDGQNIRDVALGSLRRQIALVPQSTNLFHRSIAENIHYGRLDASKEEILEAAKMAQAHAFIESLPDGYETFVGERGVKLSGGQRQRISIARAILKNSPILILDEATSALDSESEVAIQEALKQLMKGRTVIAIAHRLSTLRSMDRIVVLDEGEVVEDGPHESLVSRPDGLYARLWKSQVGGFLDESTLESVSSFS